VAFLVAETFDLGTNLSKDDLKFATDLWDDVINPACIAFEEKTGKPAEAMREAIAGVIARHVRQHNTWNMWQKVWWKRHPKIHDGSKFVTSYNCPINSTYSQSNNAKKSTKRNSNDTKHKKRSTRGRSNSRTTSLGCMLSTHRQERLKK
jgi:hypothetical protein